MRHFTKRLLSSPICQDREQYLFYGPDIDAAVEPTLDEAKARAVEMNSWPAKFTVIRFNPVEGICRDVTDEFYVEHVEEEDYPDFSGADRAYQLSRESA